MKIQPQRTWIWSRPERALAFGFGSGLSFRAPGTVGTLYAWAFYLLFEILFSLLFNNLFLKNFVLLLKILAHREETSHDPCHFQFL